MLLGVSCDYAKLVSYHVILDHHEIGAGKQTAEWRTSYKQATELARETSAAVFKLYTSVLGHYVTQVLL